MTRRHVLAALALAALTGMSTTRPALAQKDTTVTLFKIITVKDEIIIGLDAAELAALGGSDAGAVARALAARGSLTAWQYGVRRGADNEPQQSPVTQVGLLAHASLRVEPYSTTYKVLPHP